MDCYYTQRHASKKIGREKQTLSVHSCIHVLDGFDVATFLLHKYGLKLFWDDKWWTLPDHDKMVSFHISIFPMIYTTGVKQCTFHWLISSELVQKERVFNILIIHHLIIVTCISYGNIFGIFVPKCINIAPLETWEICVTVSGGICYTDYTDLKWGNINKFW